MDVIIKGNGNDSLTLSIERYEFPDCTLDDDANWLCVRVRITKGDYVWEFRDPCLMTFEYQHLADWFRRLRAEDSAWGISNLESTLEFLKEDVNGELMLAVHIGRGQPPWWGEYLGDVELIMQTACPEKLLFPLSLNDGEALARAIESQLRTYPTRYWQDGWNRGPRTIENGAQRVLLAMDHTKTSVFVTTDAKALVQFMYARDVASGKQSPEAKEYRVRYREYYARNITRLKELNLLTEEQFAELRSKGHVLVSMNNQGAWNTCLD